MQLDPKRLALGEEQYITFDSRVCPRVRLVQYDYRALDGRLFSTIAKTIISAQHRRDLWLDGECQPMPRSTAVQ